MNRLDEAVLELLSSAPGAGTVDGLRARIRRRRRRHALAIVAIAAVVSAGSVGIAASLGRGNDNPHVAVSPTTPSTTAKTNPWCVAFSRAQAVARGLAYGTVIVDEPSVHAKLVSRAELLRPKNNPLVPTDPNLPLSDHKKFWVVELRATAKSQSPYKWGLVAIDAGSGSVVTANEGPSSGPAGVVSEPATEPPYWASLPDHGSECPAGATASEPTSTSATTVPAAATQGMQPALDAWATFPVDASPRPLVLVSDLVAAPARGFATSSAKLAFSAGEFTQPPELPTGPSISGGYPVLTAVDALTILRVEGAPVDGLPHPPPPLLITSIRFGTSSFETDRGARSLPAWLFSFAGVRDPAIVLAVAPSSIFVGPTDAPRPGSVGARLAADGRTLTVSFVGSEEGAGTCIADYAVDQFASNNAVAVRVRRTTNPGGNCSAVGHERHVTIVLDAPLGNRVLVDAGTKGPIAIAP